MNLNPPGKLALPRALCASLLISLCAHAQSPTPTPAAAPSLSGSASPSPAASATPAPVSSSTPSLLKKVGVKIMFIPPPMDGTISLGIYDRNGRLIRVLHKAAAADEFVAALDGFITHWDGLDDAGKPMPPGRYFARGYMVGDLKVRPVNVVFQKVVQMIPARISKRPAGAWTELSGTAPVIAPDITAPDFSLSTTVDPNSISGTSAPLSPRIVPFTVSVQEARDVQSPAGKPMVAPKPIRVSLVDNPLDRDRAGSAELIASLDASGTWLELADGLPLIQISPTPGTPGMGDWAVLSRTSPGQPLTVLVKTGVADFHVYAITNITDMMAFDCGAFDFAGVGKW